MKFWGIFECPFCSYKKNIECEKEGDKIHAWDFTTCDPCYDKGQEKYMKYIKAISEKD